MALSYGFCLDGPETTYTSKDFSGAIHSVFGDGVCPYGSKFALSLLDGFTVSVGTGYAMADGRWVMLDEPITLTLNPSDNHRNRYDAIAVRVLDADKKVAVEVLTDVNPDEPKRGDGEYCLHLYLIHVVRGETVLEPVHVSDVRGDPKQCGYIEPLSAVSGEAEYIYKFFRSGIDEEIGRIVKAAQDVAEKADLAIQEIDQKIGMVRGVSLGDVLSSLSQPVPKIEWLPCDGSEVPAQYEALSAVIGPMLPSLIASDPKYHYWVYAGSPKP